MLTRLLFFFMSLLMAASAAAQDIPPVTEFEIGQAIVAISTYGNQMVILDAGGTIHWFSAEQQTPYRLSASGARDVALKDEYLLATAGQVQGLYELQQNVQVSTTNLDSLQLEYLSTGELVVLAADHSVSVYDEDGNVTPINFTINPEHMVVARGTGLIAVSGVNTNGETVVEIGSADDGSLLQTIPLSSENIAGSLTSIAIPSGGQVVAIGNDRGDIVVFDIETSIPDFISSGSETAMDQMAFSNNGVLLAAVAGNEVMLRDWQNQVIWISAIEDETVTALEFAGSDQGFWTGNSVGGLRFWSTGLGSTIAVGGVAAVHTLDGETVFVRAGPGTDYDVIREIPGGGYLLVVDGPVEADGYTWWNVERAGRDYYNGWMVEAIPTAQILRPPVNIEGPYFSIGVSTSTQADTDLAIDMIASVNTLNGETLNMRAGAGTSYDVVMELENTWLVHILGGPVEADGFIWWEVELQDGTRGWVIERIEELQTLLPVDD